MTSSRVEDETEKREAAFTTFVRESCVHCGRHPSLPVRLAPKCAASLAVLGDLWGKVPMSIRHEPRP